MAEAIHGLPNSYISSVRIQSNTAQFRVSVIILPIAVTTSGATEKFSIFNYRTFIPFCPVKLMFCSTCGGLFLYAF